MDGDCFYKTVYDVFTDGEKASPDNLTWWLITQSKDFKKQRYRKGDEISTGKLFKFRQDTSN